MALIMVLIFTVLLYAMTSELVTTAQTAKLTGENDVLIARMRSHMRYVLGQTEEALLSDLAAGDQEGAEGAGGLTGGLPGGAGGLPGGAGGVPGGEEQEEPDPASIADGSQDAWFEPMGHPDGDITTYVWVEDENRKFNVLTLVSPDDEFAQESRARFVRLVDLLRDGTDFDVSRADAESLAENLTQWLRGRSRTQDLPRPPLKSDSDERFDISLPLQLDELFLLVDAEIVLLVRRQPADLAHDAAQLDPGLVHQLRTHDLDHDHDIGPPGEIRNQPGDRNDDLIVEVAEQELLRPRHADQAGQSVHRGDVGHDPDAEEPGHEARALG